jgi:hypothetical protein
MSYLLFLNNIKFKQYLHYNIQMDNQKQSKLIKTILEKDASLYCKNRCHNILLRNYGIREVATEHKLDQIIFRLGIYFSFYIQHYQFPISIYFNK